MNIEGEKMTIIEDLTENRLLFDGAMGTMLQKMGLPVGMEPEYFNLSHPETITDRKSVV